VSDLAALDANPAPLQLAALGEGRTSPQSALVGAVGGLAAMDAGGAMLPRQSGGAPRRGAVPWSRRRERACGGPWCVSLEPCCHHGAAPPLAVGG